MKVRGIAFLDFIDILHEHGYTSIDALQKFEVNPLKWSRKEWKFAAALICAGTELTEKQLRKQLTKPEEILSILNEVLQKTGLIVSLEQVRQLKPEDLIFQQPSKANYVGEKTVLWNPNL